MEARMKRSITAAFAALFLLAGSGLAYGFSFVGLYDAPTVTENQHAIGEYFNTVGTDLPPDVSYHLDDIFLSVIFGGNFTHYLLSLDSLSPEKYAALPDTDLASLGQFNTLSLGRLAALRSPGTVGREPRPLFFADSGAIMLDAAPILAAPVANGTDGWGIWGETFGLFGHEGNRGAEFGYDYDTYGFALGADRAATDKIIVGLVTGYSHSFVDFNNVSFNGRIDSFDLGVYGSYNPGAWYIDASFTWVRNWHDTERDNLFTPATAEAQYHGDIFAWYAGGGYGINIGRARITPAASLTYIYYNQPRFTEDGAGSYNLFIHRLDSHSLVSRLGLTFSYEVDLDRVTIVPEASAEWAHEYLDTSRTIVSRLAAVGGATFEADGVRRYRDSALLGLGVTAYFGKGFSVYGDYDAEIRRNYDSHGFTVGVRYEF
jgi:uncharacterized protein with beta-barrel porin domain